MKEKDLLKQAMRMDMPDIEAVREKCIQQNIVSKIKPYIYVKRLSFATGVIVLAVVISMITLNLNRNTGNDTFINKLYVNELDEEKQDIQAGTMLGSNDFVSANKQELRRYYGIDIFSAAIPNDLNEIIKRKEREKRNMVSPEYGFYKNQERGGIYYDLNTMLYTNDKDKREIWITVLKGQLPHTDILDFDGESRGKKKSVINGNEVLVYHYSSNDKEFYYADFIYKDVGFRIGSINISKSEFTYVIESLLK